MPMTPLETGHRLPQAKVRGGGVPAAAGCVPGSGPSALVRPGLPAGSSSWTGVVDLLRGLGLRDRNVGAVPAAQ